MRLAVVLRPRRSAEALLRTAMLLNCRSTACSGRIRDLNLITLSYLSLLAGWVHGIMMRMTSSSIWTTHCDRCRRSTATALITIASLVAIFQQAASTTKWPTGMESGVGRVSGETIGRMRWRMSILPSAADAP
ncbi:hypothetical protein L209DRAFT_287035 [Thermothelomyces heterothallicus CBS 203.75]